MDGCIQDPMSFPLFLAMAFHFKVVSVFKEILITLVFIDAEQDDACQYSRQNCDPRR